MKDRLLNLKIGKIVVYYIIITYLSYLFILSGDFHTSDMHEIYSIIFLTFVCISFFWGCKNTPIESSKYFSSVIKRNVRNIILTISLSIFIIITVLYLFDMVTSGIAQISLSMGDNYANMLDNEMTFTSIWGQFYTLLSPARVILISYCIVNFNNLTKINIVLLVSMLCAYLMLTVSKGQFVGIGNVVVFITVPLLFKNWYEGTIYKFKRQATLLGLIFVILFIVNQLVRSESLGSDIVSNYSQNNVFYQIFGQKIGSGIMRLFMYFSHGYKGLNYSLQLPFEWTNGYGGSRALDQYMQQYFGLPSCFNNTYPMRVNAVFGYDCQTNWPTAFAWWASDFSFPGVILVMFFVGKYFCKVFRDACYHMDIVAISLLCELTILLLFLPMNNQAFQTRESLLITVLLFIAWLVHRKQYQI